ncbi:hypothetical protein V1505DRAFT_389117 [Lipomyces doorenjongii]
MAGWMMIDADSLRYLKDVRERIRITRWEPVQEILRQMSQQIDGMERCMEQRLDSIEGHLIENADRAADGGRMPFYVIPYCDGSLLKLPPYNLPALSIVDVIENMNSEQLRKYSK